VNALLLIHIAAGSIALAAGAAAMTFKKGSRRHGKAGTWFFASMLVMGSTGAVTAAIGSERGTALIGIITCYLVLTAWVTARKRDGTAGVFELAAFVVAAGCAAIMFNFGLQASASPTGTLDSLPAAAHYPFAAVAALAAGFDLSFVLRRRIGRQQRIARHLWRMCAALFIAAASFFLGQQDEFPAAWRGAAIWFVPPFATLAAMAFWLVRVRFAKAWRPRARPAPSADLAPVRG
jgi:hypothetical protein